MRRKFIAAIAILALIFMMTPSVDAQNIIKIGKDITIGNGQLLDVPVKDPANRDPSTVIQSLD